VNFSKALLWPLTLPYGTAVRLRARAYRGGLLRQRRLDGMVISVGNLTVGGTGKTPMVLWIAEHLIAEGNKTGILTRGYGGRQTSAGPTSDEVRLLQSRLADRAAFGVGADRFARGGELVRRGIEWFILDDAFQHLELARDVDIVLLDASNPFGGGHLLPAGRLREPTSALARADIIVITRTDHAPAVEAIIRRESQAPVFYARMHIESVHVLEGKYPGVEDPNAQARRFFVFCGIGNPAAFLADLRAAAFDLVGHSVFGDHHRYTRRDASFLEAAARAAGAGALLCTEKDVFNLPDGQPGSMPVCYCRSSLRVEHEDEFWRAIMEKAQPR